jgi:hypothetical protein
MAYATNYVVKTGTVSNHPAVQAFFLQGELGIGLLIKFLEGFLIEIFK